MNRTYCLVWNRALRMLQVASELARSHGGTTVGATAASLPRRHPLAIACIALLTLGAFSLPAWAQECVPSATQTCGSQGGNGGVGDGAASGQGGMGNGGGGQGAGGAVGAIGTGGNGGAGSYGDVQNPGGAGGSVGATSIGSVSITGGDGVTPPTGGNYSRGGGGGGGGGDGVYTTDINNGLAAGLSITGGNGGNGAPNDAQGGGGGGGGAGVVTLTAGAVFTNAGSVTGGKGGNGAETGWSGGGGGGGDGVLLAGANSTLNNSGTITGGDGGTGPQAGYVFGTGGTGGSGVNVTADNTQIINSGTITAGLSANGTTRADAVKFWGTGESLDLEAGSALNGAVEVVNGASATISAGADGLNLAGGTPAGDALIIDGATTLDTDGHAFSVSGAISGSAPLMVNGGGTLTLAGSNTFSGGTTVGGVTTLSVSSDANLGAAPTTALPNQGAITLDSGTLENTQAFATARNITLGSLNGGTFDTAADLTVSGVISGPGLLFKQGAGTLTLTQANTYMDSGEFPFGTELDAGTLQIDNVGALGRGRLWLAGGTLLANTTGTLANDIATPGVFSATIAATTGNTLTLTGGLNWPGGSLHFGTATDTGTVVWNPVFMGTGVHPGLFVDGGTLQLGADIATYVQWVEGATTVAGGATLDLDDQSGIIISQLLGGGTVATGSNLATVLTVASGSFTGGIQGAGGLTLACNTTFSCAPGVLTLGGSGLATYGGATTITSAYTLQGSASDAFSAASATTVDAGGVLDLGGLNQTIGSLAGGGSVINSGSAAAMLTVGGDNSSTSFGGVIQDVTAAIGMQKTGTGSLTLDGINTYTGLTEVQDGALIVGDATHATAMISGNTQVGGGATLAGFGTAGGAGSTVAIESGGILSPGAGSNSLGTLNVGGGLMLAQGSVLDFDFGAPAASNPNTTPGVSDHVAVAGTLTFDGGSTLNINDAGGMGPGLYNLASYGSLAMNNCAIGGSGTQCVALGSMPAGTKPYNFTVINNTQSKQVDLYDTAGMTLNIWDPSGNTSQLGGTGTWTMTSSTWTDPAGDGPAAMTPQPGFAIFQGTPGTVAIDDGTTSATQVSATGLQFAVDGYTLTGLTSSDYLALVGTTSGTTTTAPIIEVGDGSSASAGMTATISASLYGTAGFSKTGAGTLVLTGEDVFVDASGEQTAAVAVQAGTLQIGNGTLVGGGALVSGVLEGTPTMAAGTSLVLDNGAIEGGGISANAVAVTGQDFTLSTQTSGTGISAIQGIAVPGSGAGAGSAISGSGFTATFTGNTFVTGSGNYLRGSLEGNDAPAITGSGFHIINNANFGVFAPGGGSPRSIPYGISGTSGSLSQTGAASTGSAGIAGSNFTVENSGGIYGGEGGPTQTGTVGAGGAGIGGSGFTLTNTGKITGGAGGGVYAASGNYTPGTGTLTGLGGVGVMSTGGATVINEGTISGGASGTGLAQGDAIDFTGGGNTLELVAGHPGTFNGAIVVTRAAGDAADTLELGGDSGSDTFDLSQLASGGEFGGFNAEAKFGASTWTLTGTGSTTENWTVAGGTLVGDATTFQGSIAFAPASGVTATVAFNQTSDGTFAGAISGAGDLTKTGTGTLILTGANTFTGSTTISAGTLQVGDGGTTGAIGTGAITDDGTLVFDRSDAITLTGAISGSGSLTKQGTNTLTVNGDGSEFAGTTTIPAGTLTVGDDSHAGAALGGMVNIAKGATLTGIGTIGGMDLSGTLSPGGSIGTFHVTGDATFETGSTFNVEAGPDGEADQFAVTGTTTIKGGNTLVLSQPGNWNPSTTYTIITSGGGVSGTFSGVSDNQAFLTPTLGYSADAVTLTLARNDVNFGTVATTPNQKAVAGGLEGLGFGNVLYDAVVKLTAADARVAFDQTSGEFDASQQTARIEDSRYIREAMNQRLRAGDNDPEAAKAGSLSLWAHGFGHWGTVDGDGNAAGLADNGDGLLIGADTPLGTQARIGVTGGASRNSLSVRDRSSWGRQTSTWLGGFAGYDAGAFGLRSGIAYAWDQIPTNREVNFPGFSDRLSGNATGDTLTGFVEGAWTFHFNQASVTPFLNVAHTKVETDASTEAGGPAALHAFDATTNVSFTTLGARGEVSLAHHLNLHGELGWQHAFGDTTPEADLQFVAGGPAFTEYGVPVAKNAGLGRIGIGWHQGNVAVSADYEGLAGNGVKDQAAKVSVSVTF
ncbi:MAG TPA: autotransporter-associated beta strand repeat-containing protein [Rhodanobacteraceae bacterium]